MLDDSEFFPFLQSATWPGRSSCLVRPLVPPPGDLVIAHGVASASQNRYLTREALEATGYNEKDIHEQTVENLRSRHGKIPWSPLTLGGEDALIGVRTLAKVVRHALPLEDGSRVANAAISAALASGQAGTGFFGLGRSLPKHLRYPIWGMAGILGADLP